MAEPITIGVYVAVESRHGREMLLGILDYNQPRGLWNVEIHPPRHLRRHSFSGRLSGAIAMVTVDNAGELGDLPVPMVNVSGQLPTPPSPSVLVDDRAVGATAAACFLQKGYRQMAFVGIPEHGYSAERYRGFAAALRGTGAELTDLPPRTPGGREEPVEQYTAGLSERLGKLPKPLAIFACNDLRARLASRGCALAGLSVPEEVAILGVDDDELTCRLARQELSSIRTASRRMGREAARILDELLAGQEVGGSMVRVPPLRLVERRSSDAFAVEDPLLAHVLRYIRQNVRSRLSVRDLLKKFRISRRAMELRFRRELGVSPLAEIRRSRVECAKSLLAGTSLPMPQVADLSGFADAKSFGLIFRRETGTAPTEFRRNHQGTTPTI